jgi:arginine decarboxylase
VKDYLELHPFDGRPYYLGMFLVGAYQEILGDLHNLFGDTNAVHVSLDQNGYRIDHVVEGDTVSEVLGYVQYDKRHLVQCMRQANEDALRRGLLTLEESALLMRRFEEGMMGYTYLEEGPVPFFGTMQIANGGNGLTMQPRDSSPQPAATLAPEPQPEPAAAPEPPAEVPTPRRRVRG